MAEPATDPRFAAMMELERRGTLPPSLQTQLDAARAQGVVKGAKPVGVEQGKAASFYTRAMGAMQDFDKAGVGPRGLVRQQINEQFPNVENVLLNDDARQMADAAQRDFIAATLRYESGAAIPPSEFDSQLRTFFPQPGDGPEVIKQKAAARQRAVDGLRLSAGPAADIADKQREKRATETAPPTATADVATLGTNPAEAAIERAAGFQTPADKLAVTEKGVRDLIAKGGDEAQVLAYLKSQGFDPDKTDGVREAIAGARTGKPFGFNDVTPPKPPTPPINRGKGGIGETLDAGVRGLADTVLLGLPDEISAIGTTLFDGGTLRDNLDAERAVDRYDEQNNAGARITGQIAGGFALPMGAARGAVALGRTGAKYGAAYGFGSGEGVGDRLGGALTGGIVGGGVGYGLGRFGEAVAARGALRGNVGGGNAEGRATLEAGQRQGIDVLPADVGGPITRGMTATGAQLPGSMLPIRNAAARVNEQALGARDRIAANVGQAVEPEAAGEAARAGAQSFIQRTRDTGNGAYAKAERLAGGAMVDPANARMALDANIAELSQVPGGADGLPTLQTLRDALAGQFTVAGVRGMRTALRDKFIADGLRGSDLERRVNQVIDAANDDVVASLTAAGNAPAAKAYAVADRYWRNRLRVIDDTLAPIIGKDGDKSGEQVVQALNTAAKGNSARLASFVRSLPADESATVRATMISQLGRASFGTQDATGVAFSLPQFLTHWSQMQPGAKRALFDDATRSALDDLATVASGSKQAQRFANTSNTGLVGGTLATGMTAAIDVGTLGTALAAQYGAGRLLASPAFARWLARAPSANPGRHIQQLATIASREPAIAQDVLGLQQRLMQAVRSPQPIAAEEPNNPRQIPPQQ